MEITDELAQIYSPIKEELQAVERRLYALVPDDLEPISTVEKYVFDNGGKRLRPALVLLSARAVHFPASLSDQIINFATAAEMIHTATLIHDDLLDGSVLRRGHRTINSRWGNEIAILLGDHLYLKATELLTSEDTLNLNGYGDSTRIHKASNLMLQTAARIFKGEILQYRKRGKLSTTEKDYFTVIESKSASFISSCCTIGALLNGCPDADECLASYGFNLGIAFQIKDDILDLMGDEKKIGKAVGSDLRDGRLTLPIIHLMMNINNGDKEYLESVLKSSVKESRRQNFQVFKHNGFDKRQLRRIRKLLLNYGSIDYSINVAHNFAQKARKGLETLPDSNAKQSLVSLADQVINRDQ